MKKYYETAMVSLKEGSMHEDFKNEFREFIIFGAWDCFNYLLENNYIRNEYFFFNLIDIFKNINECFKIKKT